MKNNTKFIARTALLLATAIVFQVFGGFIPYHNFVVGSIVNAVLMIATAIAGLWSGIAISVIAPIVAALTNKAAIAPLIFAFSPFIIIGNTIIVVCFYLLGKKSRVAGVALGALLKFGFLYAAISVFTSVVRMKPQVSITLKSLFSWPQLITAVVGGAIALSVLKLIGKSLEK
ncbi:MAG: ECF transporter S component [Bacillota bacterium]